MGANVNSTNDITMEILRRIMLAKCCFHGLKKQLSSKALISPLLLYGTETWTLIKDNKDVLGVLRQNLTGKLSVL